MPIRFVRLTFVRCQDDIVLLFCGHRNGISALRLQPLVKLIRYRIHLLPGLVAGMVPSSSFIYIVPLGICVYSMASSTVIGLWRFSFTGLLLSACCLVSIALMPITSSRSWTTTCGRSLNVNFSFCINLSLFL